MRIYCAGGYCTLELSDDLRRRDIADIYRETGFGLLESLLLAESGRTKEKKRIDRQIDTTATICVHCSVSFPTTTTTLSMHRENKRASAISACFGYLC